MFYRIVDEAVARYEFSNGVEVAFVYDDCPPDPISDWDVHPVGVYRNDGNSIVTDPHGIIAEWDYWLEDMERFELALEDGEATEDDIPEAPEGLHRFVMRDYDRWGWPEFVVIVDMGLAKKNGMVGTSAEEFAKDAVADYGRWAAGEVLTAGVSAPGRDDEFLSGIYEDYSAELAVRMAEEFGVDMDGADLV